MSDSRRVDARDAQVSSRFSDIALAAILFVALSLWLVWAPNKALWNDEFLSLYTGAAPDAASVVHIQQHYPVSLDPPGYHVITHLCISLLGPTAFAVRLPSLLGWLTMLVCFFVFCRRLVGPEFAIFSTALTLPTAAFNYAAEARPYGLLLGLAAIALLCWQSAVRDRESRLAPVGLALALWTALLSHYLAILLLIPFAVAELVRMLRTKSIDWRIGAALGSTAVPIAMWLPFLPAASSYRTQYYSKTHLSQLVDIYAQLMAPRVARFHPFIAALVVTGMALGLIALIRKYGARNLRTEWLVVVSFALLPLFGIAVSSVATGGFESRYVVAAVLGIVPLCAMSVRPLLVHRPIFLIALLLVILAACGVASTYASRDSWRLRSLRDARLILAPNSTEDFSRLPLVVSNLHVFMQLQYYAKLDHDVVYVADPNLENKWVGNDTLDRTAINLRKFAPIHAMDFCQFISSHRRFLLTDQPGSEEWVPKQLFIDGSHVTTIGRLGTARLESVTVSDTAVHLACDPRQ
ncbi:MAG: glycosyltransferase family 39 protein [Bryobacteraceae bacterium]